MNEQPRWHARHRRSVLLLALLPLFTPTVLRAHDHTLHQFEHERRLVLAQVAQETIDVRGASATCTIAIHLEDARTRRSLPGLVRIHDLERDQPVRLSAGSLEGELILREQNWYAMPPDAKVVVPRRRLRVEAFHGLETEAATQIVDVTGQKSATVSLRLNRFYDARNLGWRSGNTHLHLRGFSREQAAHYLQTVSRADDLDLVFVSYLSRASEDRDYSSNQFTAEDLDELSNRDVRFANGEEHRHNFGGYDEGYGHVMFLLIKRLIEPVSIGPGIMGTGTDGIPLQRGIQQARRDGATVIWCHNDFGHEDIPNWIGGLLHAQNIFDGGSHGDYSNTFYRYLNLGLHVPFSTGTDWFIYDFSRVYVPMRGGPTRRGWLQQLREGKSFITNGPFLEFEVEGHPLGDTLRLNAPALVKVKARGIGRVDFDSLELMNNAQVVHRERCRATGGHFDAVIETAIEIRESGWLSLRLPLTAGKNEFGRPLFAHTSPIYVEVAGKRIFRAEVADALRREMQDSMVTIKTKGTYKNDGELQGVLGVYRRGIEGLERMRPVE